MDGWMPIRVSVGRHAHTYLVGAEAVLLEGELRVALAVHARPVEQLHLLGEEQVCIVLGSGERQKRGEGQWVCVVLCQGTNQTNN